MLARFVITQSVAPDDELIGREHLPETRQRERADDSTDAKTGKEQPITARVESELLARDERQQGPQCAGAHNEDHCPGEHGANHWREPHIPQASEQRFDEPLGVRGRRRVDALPLMQDYDGGQERHRVQQEHPARTSGCDDQPAERWPDGPCEVEPGAVQRDGVCQLAGRHNVRDDCLPGGAVDRSAEAKRKGEDQQRDRGSTVGKGEPAEDARGDEHPGLANQEQSPTVDQICQRASREADREGQPLAFQILVTSLALVVASTVIAAVGCLLSVALGGWLFWKLLRVMSRIGAGERMRAGGR